MDFGQVHNSMVFLFTVVYCCLLLFTCLLVYALPLLLKVLLQMPGSGHGNMEGEDTHGLQ